MLQKSAYAAYGAETHTIYVAYPSGLIRSIDLNSASLSELPFAILPTAPLGLAVAGSHVFASDSSGAWGTHRTFDSNGVQVSARDWNYYSDEYIWSAPNQKMYFFRDDTSPNDLLWEEINANGTAYPGIPTGGIGASMDTPLHGTSLFVHPIRLSPDGSVAVLGSGAIFNANNLAKLPIALANSVRDITWHGGQIKTTRTVSGKIQLQSWTGPTLAPGITRSIPGKALRLFSLDNERLLSVGYTADGIPSFYVLNTAFELVAPSSLARPAGLAISNPSAGHLLLSWMDISGETGYIVERKPYQGSSWTTIGMTGMSSTSLEFPTTRADDTIDYRVIATHGTLRSEPSLPLENVVSGPPPTPRMFSASPIDATQVALSWQDVELETNYRIQKKTSSGFWRNILTTEADVVSATQGELKANILHEFRLQARNSLGESDWIQASCRTKGGKCEIDVLLSHLRNLVDGRSNVGFGSAVYRKTTTLRLLTVENSGQANLVIRKVSVTGPNAGDFEIGELEKISIRKGKAASFVVTFNPRDIGKREAVVQIFSNDSDESTFDIKLTGYGKTQ